jgi:hypothetical protein
LTGSCLGPMDGSCVSNLMSSLGSSLGLMGGSCVSSLMRSSLGLMGGSCVSSLMGSSLGLMGKSCVSSLVGGSLGSMDGRYVVSLVGSSLGLMGGSCLSNFAGSSLSTTKSSAKSILGLVLKIVPAPTRSESILATTSPAESRPPPWGAVLLTVLSSTAHCSTFLTTLGPSLATAGFLAYSSGPPRLPANCPAASAMRQPRPQLRPPH